MDLLFSRYASPFSFIDVLISSGRFSEGVSEIYSFSNEEREWDFFLHKVFDKSFDDFKSTALVQPQEMTSEDFETTVNKSKSMLQGFVPEKSGGWLNGII